ncbi:MAG: Tfp pilus assembly protein FimT/FimU [Gammaproteobacteria bacterium]
MLCFSCRTIRSNQKGFSLLEILVVLIIIGFMVVLIPPRLSGVMASTHAKASARDMVSALRQSRNHAISSQNEQLFKLDLEKKTFTYDQKKIKKLPENLKISLYTAQSEQFSDQIGAIRFFPDGSSTGGRIKLSMNNLHLFIDINWLTGKVVLLENIDPEQWKPDQQ